MFDLIYFQEKNDVFLKRWDSIKKKILGVDYPKGYPVVRSEDISQNYQNSSIKVFKVIHENGLVFYHIMANLCYVDKNA